MDGAHPPARALAVLQADPGFLSQSRPGAEGTARLEEKTDRQAGRGRHRAWCWGRGAWSRLTSPI